MDRHFPPGAQQWLHLESNENILPAETKHGEARERRGSHLSRFAQRTILLAALWIGGLAIAAVLIWVGITAQGNPNPLESRSDSTAAVFDISVLVFREGLECILVISAVLAGMVGSSAIYRRPVSAGIAAATVATLITWRIAVGVIDDLSTTISALALQAATGLLAIVVLLVVMNWFFHKLYWTGWIPSTRKRSRSF